MRDVDMELKVLSVSEPKQIISGSGIEHEILEAEVEDETGKIKLVLWDDQTIPLKVGDVVQVRNGFVSSFKGEWRINIGKSGEVEKV
jgi:replication factor A1